jgi:hypothetical protein
MNVSLVEMPHTYPMTGELGRELLLILRRNYSRLKCLSWFLKNR